MKKNQKSFIEPNIPKKNNGKDNIDGDLIVYLNDEFISPDGEIFIVKNYLGKGEFGHVYKVSSTKNSQLYAMKISKSDEDSIQQFYYEVYYMENVYTSYLIKILFFFFLKKKKNK